jgi:hypothetical protein
MEVKRIVPGFQQKIFRMGRDIEAKHAVIGIIILLLIIFVFYGFSYASADPTLMVSEVMTSNRNAVCDEDGEYCDWIEIYNPGRSPVNLGGYGLSDDKRDPFKWKFPDVTIEPGGYMIVFASGKDRTKPGDGAFLHTSFELNSAGDKLFFTNSSGQSIGRINIPKLPSDMSYGLDLTDKGGYLYYKKPTPGKPNGSGGVKELVDKGTAAPAYMENPVVFINEFMVSNKSSAIDEDGEYSDWVELYNSGSTEVNLSGYSLTDDKQDLFKWRFPDISIAPGQYLLVFTSGKDRSDTKQGFLHTNFKINRTNDILLFCSNEGQIIDELEIKGMPPDVSKGRGEGDRSKWLFFTEPTPRGPNNTHGFDEFSMEAPLKTGQLVINEASAMNMSTVKDDKGQYSDWLEIVNNGEASLNLQAYGLSDDEDSPFKWRFPDVAIDPGEHMLVYASGESSYNPSRKTLHTNFSLSSNGESIILTDRWGRTIDRFNTGKLGADMSCGRNEGGKGERVYFQKPTPGGENKTPVFIGYTQSPELSNPGGSYSAPINLAIKPQSHAAVIRYTLDGSEPGNESQVYSSPIQISKTTVVKAKAFDDNMLPSPTVTYTYFINDTHTLPVISISTSPDNFWNPRDGLYVKGYGASSVFPYVGANYWKDIEKPIHFELYETDGKLAFSTDAGIKIFGSYSRAMDQKSFSIYARDKYGDDEMNYKFFPDKDISSFKSILLRTSGQDAAFTRIRDAMVHKLVIDTDVDAQAYRPSVVYINGQYWGIYNMREKISPYYLESNHGANPDKVDILEANGRIKAGDKADYKALVDFVSKNDMRVARNYEYVKSQMDVQEFMDYEITEIYCANTDTGNIKFWRDKSTGQKWRWILFDTDWGFLDVDHNTLEYVTNPIGTGIGKRFSTALMFNLLKNDSFRDEFISRLAYHLNNTFESSRVIAVIDEMVKAIEPEMPRCLERWGGTMEGWKKRVEVLRSFARNRPAILVRYIQQKFHLSSSQMQIFKVR